MHRRIGALFGALALSLVGAFALAGPAAASAQLPYVDPHVEDCESAYLTLVNPRKYGVTFAYSKDGGDPVEVNVAAGSKQDVPLGYQERSGDHTVDYRVSKSPESDDREVAGTVTVDCLTDVTPAAPAAEDATCDGPGTIIITRTEGVRWKLDGTHIGKGRNAAEPGTYQVTAHPRQGYELADGADSSWTLTVGEATGCESPSPEPSEPEPSEPSEPSESPSAPIQVTDPPAAGGGGGGDSQLPVTGVGLTAIGGTGLALLIAGGAVLWLARRRNVGEV